MNPTTEEATLNMRRGREGGRERKRRSEIRREGETERERRRETEQQRALSKASVNL